MGRRVFRNYYKGHMDKTKVGWKQGREVGLAGVEGAGYKINIQKSVALLHTNNKLSGREIKNKIPFISKYIKNIKNKILK